MRRDTRVRGGTTSRDTAVVEGKIGGFAEGYDGAFDCWETGEVEIPVCRSRQSSSDLEFCKGGRISVLTNDS